MDRLRHTVSFVLVNCVFETQGRITECGLITTANRIQISTGQGRQVRDVVVRNGAKTNKKNLRCATRGSRLIINTVLT
jgi:hypothetical protein